MTPPPAFSRNELLLGLEAAEKLTDALVVIVGLGAVGSFALEALARAGVGRFRLADFDKVRPCNLNRLLTATHSTLGRKKVEAAAARVAEINPDGRVEALDLFADETSYPRILAGPPDVLIDAIDSVGPKAALLTAAVNAGARRVISCMGAANRGDPLAVKVAMLSKTRDCPLAREVRGRVPKGLQQRILAVYSDEAPWNPPAPPEPDGALRRGRPRRTLGSLCCVTGVFGLVAAREAIRAITDR
ncbi:MAG TPA: tRNA threonylcarbamoyladenosine dehydratase [Kiritimatiellia bacterium]|nr:tRNA threonylcarbamoyladenosine dehydratase [Kiritimatiellia bacterium]HRZ13805.1 tRNA threonylcarbamoyladenosine dehydratase [Kiritimatiellia bacterium]HSA19426.1 tRNA threonylcarbamoyladenosine dehydratase [Kiritimatiellia bacterium]